MGGAEVEALDPAGLAQRAQALFGGLTRGLVGPVDESFRAFAERVGTGEFEGLVKDLSMPVEFGLETMNQFIDWNRDVPFQVIRGEVECAV